MLKHNQISEAMENGDTIVVYTEGKTRMSIIDQTNRDGEHSKDKFIILLEEGETIEDGEHFLSEFEPVPPTTSSVRELNPLSGVQNYLRLNKGNGF